MKRKIDYRQAITRANELRQDTRQDLIARAVEQHLQPTFTFNTPEDGADLDLTEEQYNAEWRA